MKTTFTFILTLALTAICGCLGPRGGGASKDEGFRIGVPIFGTEIKQGELQTVNVSLHRDEQFKRDVKLEIKASEGVSAAPINVLIKASDKADVQIRITAAKDAALGEYRVYVKGTPETGEATTAEFKVKVVAP